MTQDWAAVATTIGEHLTKLGLNQTRLAERSGVSPSPNTPIVPAADVSRQLARIDKRLSQLATHMSELDDKITVIIGGWHNSDT